MAKKTILFDDLCGDPAWVAAPANEARARLVGGNPDYLRRRLQEAAAVEHDITAAQIKAARFDFARKRLVFPEFALEWRIRAFPDQPESDENQQTPTGAVFIVQPETTHGETMVEDLERLVAAREKQADEALQRYYASGSTEALGAVVAAQDAALRAQKRLISALKQERLHDATLRM